MKFVNFHSVTLQNFLSVGSEPVTVDFTRGLHVITGINRDKQDRRNGVGKSTIADAIHFAIFGSTIRDLKKENIVNHLTGSGTVVELIFTITDTPIQKPHNELTKLFREIGSIHMYCFRMCLCFTASHARAVGPMALIFRNPNTFP